MLGDVVSVGGDQAKTARLAAQPAHHFGNGMGHIIIPGPAEVRQTAGYRQASRVIFCQTDLDAPDLDCRWEAAVKIEEAHIVQALARHGEGLAHTEAYCRGEMELSSLRDVPVIVGIGAAMEIYPLCLRDSQPASFPD